MFSKQHRVSKDHRKKKEKDSPNVFMSETRTETYESAKGKVPASRHFSEEDKHLVDWLSLLPWEMTCFEHHILVKSRLFVGCRQQSPGAVTPKGQPV